MFLITSCLSCSEVFHPVQPFTNSSRNSLLTYIFSIAIDATAFFSPSHSFCIFNYHIITPIYFDNYICNILFSILFYQIMWEIPNTSAIFRPFDRLGSFRVAQQELINSMCITSVYNSYIIRHHAPKLIPVLPSFFPWNYNSSPISH